METPFNVNRKRVVILEKMDYNPLYLIIYMS